ncbi:MAG: cyclophane-containing peptide 2OG-Fe(II) oxygenase YhhC [Sphingobacteriales bacterium]
MKNNFTVFDQPFKHIIQAGIAESEKIAAVYDWFEQTDFWEFTQTDFYTQYEFSVLHAVIPSTCQWLKEPAAISNLEKELTNLFNERKLKCTAITAHKLVDGYRMGVHNDYISGKETHRLVIQINGDWTPDNGGYLMLFNSAAAQDVAKIVQPLNNSSIGFEISERSYHAVSTVHNFTRYTLVYTFARDHAAA